MSPVPAKQKDRVEYLEKHFEGGLVDQINQHGPDYPSVKSNISKEEYKVFTSFWLSEREASTEPKPIEISKATTTR